MSYPLCPPIKINQKVNIIINNRIKFLSLEENKRSTDFQFNFYSFFFIAICNQTCVHGACTQPYVCSCLAGWNGTSCNQGKFEFSEKVQS